MDGLEAEFGQEMLFSRLDANISPNDELQVEYGLRGHPAIAIVDSNGVVKARFFGPEEKTTLRTAILDVCAACTSP